MPSLFLRSIPLCTKSKSEGRQHGGQDRKDPEAKLRGTMAPALKKPGDKGLWQEGAGRLLSDLILIEVTGIIKLVH